MLRSDEIANDEDDSNDEVLEVRMIRRIRIGLLLRTLENETFINFRVIVKVRGVIVTSSVIFISIRGSHSVFEYFQGFTNSDKRETSWNHKSFVGITSSKSTNSLNRVAGGSIKGGKNDHF